MFRNMLNKKVWKPLTYTIFFISMPTVILIENYDFYIEGSQMHKILIYTVIN